MPRPNRGRSIQAEEYVAVWISQERKRRGWSGEALAAHMRDARCPIQPSAVYKIEDGKRRVTVDELVAFSRVLGVDVGDLLMPPDVAPQRELVELLRRHDRADLAAAEAAREAQEAQSALIDFTTAHPELSDVVGRMADEYAAAASVPSGQIGDFLRDLLRQIRLFEMTGDKSHDEQADVIASAIVTLRHIEAHAREGVDSGEHR